MEDANRPMLDLKWLSVVHCQFGTEDLIWQLDELVEPRVVCNSLPFLVPAIPDPCLLGCVRWRVVQELVGMPAKVWWDFSRARWGGSQTVLWRR